MLSNFYVCRTQSIRKTVIVCRRKNRPSFQVQNDAVVAKKRNEKFVQSPSSSSGYFFQYFQWNEHDKCLARYSEDQHWYEGTIISIDRERNTCVVRYDEYENEEEQDLANLERFVLTLLDLKKYS